MKASHLIVDAIALAVGVAAGYAPFGAKTEPEAAASAVPAAKPATVADVGEAASERALSARIRELEAMYKAAPVPEKPVAEEDAKYWTPLVVTNADGSASITITFVGGFAYDLKKHMEELREKDPKEFELQAKSHREMGDEVADGFDQRIRFFEQVDDSWMGEAERANFNQFVDKLKTTSDVWRRGGRWDLPFDQRKAVDAYKFRVNPTIPNEYPKIRSAFLNRTAEVMGLEGEAASDFISTVNDIERMTSRYTAVSLPPAKKR